MFSRSKSSLNLCKGNEDDVEIKVANGDKTMQINNQSAEIKEINVEVL